MLRLFIGLTFDGGYTRRLCRLMEGVSGVHWQPQDNLHLTLRFLGDVTMDDAEDLDAHLARITAPITSRSVRIPTSLPRSSSTGAPEISCWTRSRRASWMLMPGVSVIGFRTM